MKLYAAYGSNLCMAAMAQRCPAAKPAGFTYLRDHRLVFRSVADVEEARGQQTPLGIWQISKRCEVALDFYEGVESGLYRKEMVDFDNGEKALIYVMNRDGYLPPSEYYYQTILRGYGDFELPTSHLKAARQFSTKHKRPSAAMLAHHARRLKREASYA